MSTNIIELISDIYFFLSNKCVLSLYQQLITQTIVFQCPGQSVPWKEALTDVSLPHFSKFYPENSCFKTYILISLFNTHLRNLCYFIHNYLNITLFPKKITEGYQKNPSNTFCQLKRFEIRVNIEFSTFFQPWLVFFLLQSTPLSNGAETVQGQQKRVLKTSGNNEQ